MSRRRLAKVVLTLISLVLCMLLAEVGARIYWRFLHGIPFRHPDRILYAFYPDLSRIDRMQPSHTDKFYDILMLGDSSLNKNWSSIEPALLEQLALSGRKNARTFNLAIPAQTSRDSLLKYAALGKSRFELVIVYHGANETRTNNVPPEFFREDYGHYFWYEIVNALASHHGKARFALPYTLHFLALEVRQAIYTDRYVPKREPRKDWIKYGKNPGSVACLKKNLQKILNLASLRGDPVLLMTFAVCLPADYSYAAFMEKRLDYCRHRTPAEIWGNPEYVQAAIAVQNRQIRDLAAQYKGALFVDQAKLMPMDRRHFNDLCHMTVVGSLKFVENLLTAFGANPPGLPNGKRN